MKRELIGFIAGCVLTASFLLGIPALANTYNQMINVDINKISVYSEHKKMTGDTILWNNKTYIPMRETLETANCMVDYNGQTNTVEVLNRFHSNVPVFAVNGALLPVQYQAIYIQDLNNINSGIHYYVDMNYFVDLFGYKKELYNYNGETIMNFVDPSTTASVQTNQPSANNINSGSYNISKYEEYYIYSDDDKNRYLGKITSNSIDTESIWNTASLYGSSVGLYSVWNTVGTYGSETSMYSASATLATHPPKIYDSNGNFVAYLTENTAKYPRYTKSQLTVMFTK